METKSISLKLLPVPQRTPMADLLVPASFEFGRRRHPLELPPSSSVPHVVGTVLRI
jgi:hypothetical protein